MFGEGLSLANQEHQRLLIALRESEILRELAGLLASSLDLTSILEVLVKRTAEVCAVERCAVWLLEDAQNVFQPTTYHLSTQHLDVQAIKNGDALWFRTPLPLDDPVVKRLLNSKGLLAVEDLYAEPSLQKVAESFLVHSVLLVALMREDRPVGMMSLDNPGKMRNFPTELQQLVRAIGQQAAIAIDNARLYQQVQAERKKAEQLIVSAYRDISEQLRVEQRLRQALETMLHVAEAVSGRTEIKDILQYVLSLTLNTLNCERGLVHLYDEKQQAFTPLLSIGFSKEAEELWVAEQSCWLTPGTDQYSGFRTQLLDGHATLVNAEQCPLQPNTFSSIMVLVAPIMQNNRVTGLIMLDRSVLFNSEARGASSQKEPNSNFSTAGLYTDEFTIWDIVVIEGIAKLTGLAMEQASWQQEALKARTDEAAMREANVLKDEFLAITAHEFRTPLTVILAHSQVALRTLRRAGIETVTTLVENLSTIEEQTRQLTNIVNTFLEVTQLNRGQLTLKIETVDLAEIAEQVVADHSATSADHTISCKIEPSGHPYFVRGDSARLLQIIANLVENAIKYSPHGGPISVSMRKSFSNASQLIIEACVEDKGIGVPKDAQARLFERFYRAPNIEGNKTRGTGLGLYVVAQLLQMHGGDIYVESSGTYGEGSRFHFTLPALV